MFLGRNRRVVAGACALAAVLAASCGKSSPSPGPGPANPVDLTAVTPSSGSTFGGTTITITGSGFSSGATVTVGGTAATDVAVVSSTSITAKTPAHAAGAGDVKVTVGTQGDTLAGAFTFITPTVGPNTPPTVGSISVTPPRTKQPKTLATIGDRITLTSTINDAETALSALSIEWSALPNIGSFTGSGASVQWTAPESTTSPQTVVLMLTVLEHYLEPDASGLPVAREHRVQKTVEVRVHDTVKEVSDMAVDFLTLFSNSNLGPEEVLHNFSQTCDGGKGYNSEYKDIVQSRDEREILTFDIKTPTKFEWGFGKDRICTGTDKRTAGDVCVSVPVTWTDREIGSATVNTVSGTDFVSAAYEGTQWRLCHSSWEAFDTLTGRPVMMDYSVPSIIKGPQQK